jgi:hypothetical protein
MQGHWGALVSPSKAAARLTSSWKSEGGGEAHHQEHHQNPQGHCQLWYHARTGAGNEGLLRANNLTADLFGYTLHSMVSRSSRTALQGSAAAIVARTRHVWSLCRQQLLGEQSRLKNPAPRRCDAIQSTVSSLQLSSTVLLKTVKE